MAEPSKDSWDRRVVPYAVALAGAAASVAIQLGLHGAVDGLFPLAVFPVAIVLIAWFAGIGPALLATAFAVLLADYYLLQPVHSLRLDKPSDALGLLLFALAGILVCLAMRALHRTLARERRGRTDAEGALRRSSLPRHWRPRCRKRRHLPT